MADYCLTFEIDSSALRAKGYSREEVQHAFGNELPAVLAELKFSVRLSPLAFATHPDASPLLAVAQVIPTLQARLPDVCRCLSNVRIMRVSEITDITRELHGGLVPHDSSSDSTGRVVSLSDHKR